MDITIEQLKLIEKFVQQKLDCLNFKHAQQAKDLAVKIGKAEKADLSIITASALLHDVGKCIEDKNHARHSANLARKFLEREKFETRFVEEVVYGITCHEYAWQGRLDLLTTIEAKVVADADMLCSLTALGILKWIIYFRDEFKKDFNSALEDIQKINLNIKNLLSTKTGRFLYREYLTEANKFYQRLI